MGGVTLWDMETLPVWRCCGGKAGGGKLGVATALRFVYTYSNHQNCRHPSGRQLSQLPLSQKLESHQGFLRFWGFGS
jgi:hypothetical protein